MGSQPKIVEQTPEQRAEHDRIRAEIDEELPEILSEAHAVRDRLVAFGSRLREAREAAGLTLAEMAERSGIDKGNLSRLESGRQNPTLDTIAKCAEALGKTFEIRFVDAA